MPAATSYFKPRVYAGQRGIEGESWGVDDMTDIYSYLDSGTGKDATIRSPTYYWDNACRFARPNDLLYSYNVRSGIIDHDVDVHLPVVPATVNEDWFLFRDTPQEIKNKTIKPDTNTLTGIEKFPDYYKSGKYQASNFKGEGLLESLVHMTRPELKGDDTEGSYAQYQTTVTPNTMNGYVVENNFLTMGKFDPVVKTKIRLPDFTVNTNRFFFGFVSSDSVLINDVPFGNADAALMMGFRNGDADFKLFRGIGNNTTIVSPHSTNKMVTHSTYTLEFGFKNQGTVVYYRIDDGEEILFANNLPSIDRWLKLHCAIQNTTTEDKLLDLFYTRIESRK